MSIKSDRNSSEAFSALKQFLIENFDAKEASGGKEVIKRCHFCGDSRDGSSRHLYIGQTPNGTIVYNCFKCQSNGVVDGKFLRNLGCYDAGLIELCQEQNIKSGVSNFIDSNTIRNYNSFHKLDGLQIIAKDTPFTKKKLAYLFNRLGYEFSIRDLINFKVVLNLKEFLDFNNIEIYTRHPNLIEQLDKFYLGFLSMDNRYVILRRLVPEGKVSKYIDSRYVNYDIFGGYKNFKNDGIKTYAIPTSINTLYPVNIHIAEGIFDIISIYMNVADRNNGLFVAINGKSYESVIKMILSRYGFINFNMHIYLDNDVSQREVSGIKPLISSFCSLLTFHRNSFEDQKDFGVRKEFIKDSIMKG